MAGNNNGNGAGPRTRSPEAGGPATVVATPEVPKAPDKNTVEVVNAQVADLVGRFTVATRQLTHRNAELILAAGKANELAQKNAELEKKAEERAAEEREKVSYKVRKLFGRLSPEERLTEAKIEADKFDRDMVDVAEMYLKQKIGGNIITKDGCDKYLKQGSGEPNPEIEELESNGRFYNLKKNEVLLHQVRARADEIARKVSFGVPLENAKKYTIESNKQAKIKADSSVLRVTPLPPIPTVAPVLPVEVTPPLVEAPKVAPLPAEAVPADLAAPEARPDPQVEAVKAQLAAEKAAREKQQEMADLRWEKMFQQMTEMTQKQAEQQQKIFESMQAMQQNTAEMFTKAMQTSAETMGKAMQEMATKMAESQEKTQQATLAAINKMNEQQAESQQAMLGAIKSQLSEAVAGLKTSPRAAAGASNETPQAQANGGLPETGQVLAGNTILQELDQLRRDGEKDPRLVDDAEITDTNPVQTISSS